MLPVEYQKSPQEQNTPKCHGDVAMSMLIPSVFPCFFGAQCSAHLCDRANPTRTRQKPGCWAKGGGAIFQSSPVRKHRPRWMKL